MPEGGSGIKWSAALAFGLLTCGVLVALGQSLRFGFAYFTTFTPQDFLLYSVFSLPIIISLFIILTLFDMMLITPIQTLVALFRRGRRSFWEKLHDALMFLFSITPASMIIVGVFWKGSAIAIGVMAITMILIHTVALVWIRENKGVKQIRIFQLYDMERFERVLKNRLPLVVISTIFLLPIASFHSTSFFSSPRERILLKEDQDWIDGDIVASNTNFIVIYHDRKYSLISRGHIKMIQNADWLSTPS